MRKARLFNWVAALLGVIFLALQLHQWHILQDHQTVVFRTSDKVYVADFQSPSKVRRLLLATSTDVHSLTASDFQNAATEEAAIIPTGDQRLVSVNYGPSRNNFFASYFLMSAVHSVHLVALFVALLWMLMFRKGRLPAALQNYWHFVNVVGVIGLITLYSV